MPTVYPKKKRAPRQAVAPVNLPPASAGAGYGVGEPPVAVHSIAVPVTVMP